MAGCRRPPKSHQPSIKYCLNSAEGASFKRTYFVPEEYAPTVSDYKKQSGERSGPKSNEILSSAELVTAIDQIWSHANHISIFQPKANLNRNLSSCMKEDILDDLSRGENGRPALSAGGKILDIDFSTASQLSPKLQPNFEFLKVTRKISLFEPCHKNYTRSFMWSFLQGGTNFQNELWKGKCTGTIGMSYEMGDVYQWMKEIIPVELKNCVTSTQIWSKQTGENCIPRTTSYCGGGCISRYKTCPESNLTTGDAGCCSDLVKSKDPLLCNNATLITNTGATTSLCSDNFLVAAQDNSISGTPSSSLCTDDHIDNLSSGNYGADEGWEHLTAGTKLLENERKQSEKLVKEDKNGMEIRSSPVEKPRYALAKQEHAFAGAFAGVFVSLSLHPVDTVKTVIQSCHAEQRSLCYIGRSIVSKRGLSGLYRGLASNIASSAPISAIYTFTYESAKGALLPLFPKEYCSLAHCMAGGCASVATSSIFTPSERIKQQMQINAHYHSCWDALVGIIRKGGFRSLYAGWGAVLCRNVPHSIIKFYVYESLKGIMPSRQSGSQLNTLQTLVCGGLAGSTAALFTTPFDVVKTRLQTQVPGSRSQYHSVFQALQEIGKQEGLKGLYRGLVPRLVMYMSQGALFFASYEFFKSLFSLEVPKLSNVERIQLRQNDEDNSVPSSSPTLQNLHS